MARFQEVDESEKRIRIHTYLVTFRGPHGSLLQEPMAVIAQGEQDLHNQIASIHTELWLECDHVDVQFVIHHR